VAGGKFSGRQGILFMTDSGQQSLQLPEIGLLQKIPDSLRFVLESAHDERQENGLAPVLRELDVAVYIA